TSFSTRNVATLDGTVNLFVDRAANGAGGFGVVEIDDSGALSYAGADGNVLFGNLIFGTTGGNLARTIGFTGRNGYCIPFAGTPGTFPGPLTLTNSLSGGLLSINGSITFGEGTQRALTINGNADTLITGYFLSAGAGVHNLAKAGTGMLVLTGENTAGG